ncbi:MAG: hypothetical protein ACP5UI_02625 [Thermoprotei archaeon]|nr:hypothetical protein [TACK group archaeon]
MDKRLAAVAALALASALILASSAASARPPYVFNGSKAVYQLNWSEAGKQYSATVTYQITQVNASNGSFVVGVKFTGALSGLNGLVPNRTATFSNPWPFPALNATLIAALNAGKVPPAASNVTVTPHVALSTPAGTFSTDELNFGGGNYAWYDMKTGLLVKQVGPALGYPSSVFELEKASLAQAGSAFAYVELLLVAVGAALLVLLGAEVRRAMARRHA